MSGAAVGRPDGSWSEVGPPTLGFAIGADADVVDGWLVRPLWIPPGLDGPRGILQGGFAATIAQVPARLADTFGAPVTSVSSRLHAPTPLGTVVSAALRPADGTARHEVQLRDGDRLLVSSTVELAGHDPAPRSGDLLELASVPLPPEVPNDTYPDCWVCGNEPHHPHALRLRIGRHGEGVVIPWTVDEALADADGNIDPLVVGAALDCPGVWSVMPRLLADGFAGCLMGGMELRPYRPVPAYEPVRIVARTDQVDGRKVRVRVAIVDEDATVYALASGFHVAVAEMPAFG